MAIVRKEPKDIDGLGPIGIVVEAFKIFSGHAKTFILIQLTLMLPLTILLAVADYFLIASLPPPNVNQPGGLFKVFFAARDAGPDLPLLLLTLLPSYGLIIVLAVAQSLSHSTNLYCVGLHYAGQPVFFIDALRAATPRLWMRLALTTTYLNFLSTLIPLVMIVGFILLQHYIVAVMILSAVTSILSIVAAVGISIILMIASGVSVLEEDYGWAAIKKSLKLLKGKVKVAVLFQLLCLVPGVINMSITNMFLRKGQSNMSPWTVAGLVLAAVVFLVWTIFIWQLQILSAGVQYVSFKAYHGESLSRSLYENRTTEGGYAVLSGDGNNEALLGGQPADNRV